MLRLRPPDYQGLVAGYQGLVVDYQGLVAGCQGLVGAGQTISEQLCGRNAAPPNAQIHAARSIIGY